MAKQVPQSAADDYKRSRTGRPARPAARRKQEPPATVRRSPAVPEDGSLPWDRARQQGAPAATSPQVAYIRDLMGECKRLLTHTGPAFAQRLAVIEARIDYGVLSKSDASEIIDWLVACRERGSPLPPEGFVAPWKQGGAHLPKAQPSAEEGGG